MAWPLLITARTMIAAESMEKTTDGLGIEQIAIHMPLGLLGFEETKQFVLLANPGEEPFRWLQMSGASALAFLVVSPFEVLPSYNPEINDQDAAFLEIEDPAEASLLNIVTLRANGPSTINLKGPIVVNRRTLRAKQVIISNAIEYSLQHPLPVGE